MRVLAIDPGFGRCGVAILEGSGSKPEYVFSECIETDTGTEFIERLNTVAETIIRHINEHAPDIVALEELYFTNNQKTAIHVAEIRGMLMYIARSHHLPLVEFNPLAVKIGITGYGRASKDDVTKMVERLIALPQRTMLDDEYDAIALGITALAETRHRAAQELV